MPSFDLRDSVELAYAEIVTRSNKTRETLEEKGVFSNRIPYEDISLEDLLDDVLLPLLPEIIDTSSELPLRLQKKCYKVYVATLCEMVKNGLVNGGILKTIEARIGSFNINRHYALLKKALANEGIQIIDKPKKYEETIINEAGIPRGYHKKCLELFSIYWKWLHNHAFDDRVQFLEDFLNERLINEIYILDQSDRSRMTVLRDEVSSFSEKVIKTCVKLDKVFSAIDGYSSPINESNIDEVAISISAELGFDIFTVIRSDAIKQYIIEYAQQISFKKFNTLIAALPESEEIELPTGKLKRKGDYSFNNYYGGRHTIRGNDYDVSFPIPLDIEDIYCLEMETPHRYGNVVIYTSEDFIDVEKDGYNRPFRRFYDSEYGWLNVYCERMSPASFLYIDGRPIENESPFSKKVYIAKFWDSDRQEHRLAICIYDLRFINRDYPMRKVELNCNDINLIKGNTNSNGSFKISEKYIPLDDIECANELQFEFCVNDEIIDSWSIVLLPYYIWGRQSGLRVYDKIDLGNWYGAQELIIASKTKISNTNTNIGFLYKGSDFYIYECDFRECDKVIINDIELPIIESSAPYLKLLTEDVEVISEEYCIPHDAPLSIKLCNEEAANSDLIIRIEHEQNVKSYNIHNVDKNDMEHIDLLLGQSKHDVQGLIGKWVITLLDNGNPISEICVVRLPRLEIATTKDYFFEGEEVRVIVKASEPCFEDGGEYTREKILTAERARIRIEGNRISSHMMEIDCYNDRCGVTHKVSIAPNVWGIKNRKEETGEWVSINNRTLSKNEVSSTNLFVCSTCEMELRITSGYSELRQIHPGYNRLNCRSFFVNASASSKAVFEDEYGARKELRLIFPVSFRAGEIIIEDGSLHIPVTYEGPLEEEIEYRVFDGTEIALIVRKTSFKNRFVTVLYLDVERLSSREISVEGRTGSQDFQHIVSSALPEVDEKTGGKLFCSDMSIIELIAHSTLTTNVNYTDKVLELLDTGGVR